VQKSFRAKLEEWIPLYQAAQEKDGYFDTYFTLTGEPRLKNLRDKHEFFLMGAMMEAAFAHYRMSGGKDSRLWDVAIKCADYICSVVNPDGYKVASGHPGIEFALIELAEMIEARKGPGAGTRYIQLAKRLIDTKGDHQGRYDNFINGGYAQEHRPFVQQENAVGHAVRANYLYTAAADIARLTGNAEYRTALDKIWQSAVHRKMYLTGGVGVAHGEGYWDDYYLPTAAEEAAYQETCSSVGNVIWQYRMLLLHGDGKYADVMERTLYNAMLSGISLKGDRFFYVNPLKSNGAERWAWHGCSCCPGNVMQMILRVGDYIYTCSDDEIYLNLFVDSRAKLDLQGRQVEINQKTEYPWDGRVEVTVKPQKNTKFKLKVRIPGWTQNQPAPGDLYRFMNTDHSKVAIKVNGKSINPKVRKGYVVIDRKWKKGDRVTLEIPMPIRRILANEQIKHLAGWAVAIQRGPIVYCAEGIDNDGDTSGIFLDDEVKLTSEHRKTLLGGVTSIIGKQGNEKMLTAIPYYTWANRGKTSMNVWLRRTPPRFNASHCLGTLEAIGDGQEPHNSKDHNLPRFTWWDKKGTQEWVEERFEEPRKVSSLAVYWFDDTGIGGCRVPASWSLLYRDGETWKPVNNATAYGVATDKYNNVTFDAVETDALRVEVQLQPGYSGGILEWRINEKR